MPTVCTKRSVLEQSGGFVGYGQEMKIEMSSIRIVSNGSLILGNNVQKFKRRKGGRDLCTQEEGMHHRVPFTINNRKT